MEDITETRQLIKEMLEGTDVTLTLCDWVEQAFYHHEEKPRPCRLYHVVLASPEGDLEIKDIWVIERDTDRRLVSKTPVFNRLKYKVKEFVEGDAFYRDILRLCAAKDWAETQYQEGIMVHWEAIRAKQRQALLEMDYLTYFTWDVDVLRGWSGNHMSLKALPPSYKDFPKGEFPAARDEYEKRSHALHDILGFGHHDSFEVADGFHVRVDDGEIRLKFDKVDLFDDWRKKLGLKVVVKGLEKRLGSLEEDVAKAEERADMARGVITRFKG